jgi:cation-transporting P-type ATPase 13A2
VNSFQRESAKFLFFLFLIAVSSYAALLVINYEYEDLYDIIVKFFDLLITTVPPAIPVSMTFGIIYALERLNKKKIYCIAQNKVITGGIIDFCCFDKTGTLTEDYMNFYCIVPSYLGKFHTQVVNTE